MRLLMFPGAFLPSGVFGASAPCSTTQRRARASRAILVRAHACSVARAGTGRTQRPSASATAEQPRRRHTSAEGSQTTLSNGISGRRGVLHDQRRFESLAPHVTFLRNSLGVCPVI